MQTIFSEISGKEISHTNWKVFRGFLILGICCPVKKKRGNQLKSLFQAPQSSYHNYVSFQPQPENELLYICQLFQELNGCNCL